MVQHQAGHDSPSAAGDWPWLSAIYHLNNSQPIYKCAGNLINSNTVITVRDCVNTDVDRIRVQLGRLDFSVAGPNMQEFRARYIMSHHGLYLDIYSMALIRLAGEVIFTAFVQPVCLSIERPIAIDNDHDNDVIGQNGILVGYDYRNALIQEFAPVISRRQCSDLASVYTVTGDISKCTAELRKNGGKFLRRSFFV